MNILIVGKNAADAEALFEKYGVAFSFVESEPEMVVSYGGDGTLMEAEFRYPGIPKLYLKNSRVAKLAHMHDNEAVIAAVAKGAYRIDEHIKLEAATKGETLTALNDIVVHNADPRHGIRYTAHFGSEKGTTDEIIGDGIVVATPLGSTGYYRSITDSYFEAGIGLAFNNSTEQSDHIVLRDDRTITMTITRGPAIAWADNQEHRIALGEGDTVLVQKSKEVGKIVRVV